jgi:hypothetical protein
MQVADMARLKEEGKFIYGLPPIEGQKAKAE